MAKPERKKAFLANCTGKTGNKCAKNFFASYTRINTKWIVELNVKPKTIKYLPETRREHLYDLWFNKNVYARTSKAQYVKEKKTDKLSFTKIDGSANHTIKGMKRKAILGGSVCETCIQPKTYPENMKTQKLLKPQ